jgi:hypothetical protein
VESGNAVPCEFLKSAKLAFQAELRHGQELFAWSSLEWSDPLLQVSQTFG